MQHLRGGCAQKPRHRVHEVKLGPLDGVKVADFSSVNRNKRSVVCDLRTEGGLEDAMEIALSADVVIENFRPGVMERYGLDYESLREKRPDIVYCSITGFGTAGGAHLPGYDLLVQAVGGLMSVTGSLDAEPSKVGVALVDVVTGQNAVAGILAALRVLEPNRCRPASRSQPPFVTPIRSG